MDVNDSTLWWLAGGVLVALELATGTFYLLMLALGCAAGALTAHAGLGGVAQVLTAALLGGVAVTMLHRRRRQSQRLPAAINPDVSLDIGQPVQVERWATDGSTEVKYRGAAWQARYLGTDTPAAGRYVIRAIEGSCLLLDH